jgi:hypothetical protein
MLIRISVAEIIAPVAAEILFCEARTKKIAANSGTDVD